VPGPDTRNRADPLCRVDQTSDQQHASAWRPWYFEAGGAAIADPPDVRAKATEKRGSMFLNPARFSRPCSRGRIRSGNFCAGASRLIGEDRVAPGHRSSSQALSLLKEAAITSPNSPSDEATGNCNLLYTLSRATFRHEIEGLGDTILARPPNGCL
jgi:hypothetical protein